MDYSLFKAHDLPFFLANESRILSVYLIIVAPLDQWFSVCHTSHSGRNSIAEWHLSVLPWWRISGGSYSPASATAIITVISLLLSRPAIGIGCSPCLLIVHALTGTRWKAVWSQLITGMEGCHSLWLQHEGSKILLLSLFKLWNRYFSRGGTLALHKSHYVQQRSSSCFDEH